MRTSAHRVRASDILSFESNVLLPFLTYKNNIVKGRHRLINIALMSKRKIYIRRCLYVNSLGVQQKLNCRNGYTYNIKGKNTSVKYFSKMLLRNCLNKSFAQFKRCFLFHLFFLSIIGLVLWFIIALNTTYRAFPAQLGRDTKA